MSNVWVRGPTSQFLERKRDDGFSLGDSTVGVDKGPFGADIELVNNVKTVYVLGATKLNDSAYVKIDLILS